MYHFITPFDDRMVRNGIILWLITFPSAGQRNKSREKIITMISKNIPPKSATALAERTGISPKAVEKQIAGLNADKVTKRIGSGKGGYWQVVEKTD